MTYPESPGHKVGGTSRAAAQLMATSAPTIRDGCRVALELLGPMTPDETADLLGRTVLAIRPRFSELKAMGHIEKTGVRRKNASGISADVYRRVPTMLVQSEML